MLVPGCLLLAVNPNDPKQKLRPAAVLWIAGERALLAFGQSFDSVEGEPAFILDSKPHRGIVRHRTYFYATDTDMVVLPVKGLNPSPFRLTKDEYRSIAERMTRLGYPSGLEPPDEASHHALPSAPPSG
jgi:hypothetical protein